jgi:hypothetical protein
VPIDCWPVINIIQKEFLLFIWAFNSKKRIGGLSASIFSKQKRIYAAIPNAHFNEIGLFSFEGL